MKTNFLIVLFTFCSVLFFSSCEKATDNTAINPCGVSDPAKNLPWLAELIEKIKTDSTGNYMGEIWLEKFKEQDIFVTNMMLGSGGIMYWFFDCSGNHLTSMESDDRCPACNFVGNNHFFIEDEDFEDFVLNMKLDVIIYSPLIITQ